MIIIGWILWASSCILAIILFRLIADEFRGKVPLPSSRLKRLLLELPTLIGTIISLYVTATQHISKLHLLWLIPSSFGIGAFIGGPGIIIISKIHLYQMRKTLLEETKYNKDAIIKKTNFVKETILWILVLPISILSFIITDIVVPIILNVFISIGTYFKMSFLMEWLSPRFLGNHISLFITYFMAIYVGSIIAPKSREASIILGSLFLLLRISQTVTVFTNSSFAFTEDTPTQFVIGSIFAFLGTILGICLINKKGNKHLTK